MEEFNDNIRSWVSVDNEIKILSDRMKELRDKRNTMSDTILQQANQNNLENAVIKISDGQLNFSQINRRPPLTFKYISNCLERCIGNPESVDQIMNYIKESRPVEQVTYIRRNYA